MEISAPTPITPELRRAVIDLIEWWDHLNAGNDQGLAALARCVFYLKRAKPHPGGQLGDDLAHIIKPPRNAHFTEHIEVFERLRHLTRPGVGHDTQQISLRES